jgi:hypothetical protein
LLVVGVDAALLPPEEHWHPLVVLVEPVDLRVYQQSPRGWGMRKKMWADLPEAAVVVLEEVAGLLGTGWVMGHEDPVVVLAEVAGILASGN